MLCQTQEEPRKSGIIHSLLYVKRIQKSDINQEAQ